LCSPVIQPDQVHLLWKLVKIRKRPMTKVLRQILQEYFDAHQDELSATAATVTSIEVRRAA
jgi:hypothetical protein